MWNVVFIDKISFQNDLTCMKNSQTKSKTGFVVKSDRSSTFKFLV